MHECLHVHCIHFLALGLLLLQKKLGGQPYKPKIIISQNGTTSLVVVWGWGQGRVSFWFPRIIR